MVNEIFSFERPEYAPLKDLSVKVTGAYQTAARYMDTIQEVVFIDMGLVHTAQFIHNMAHTMPMEFDSFGNILHQRHLPQIYPATAELGKYPETVPEAMEMVTELLLAIDKALAEFIVASDTGTTRALAREAETLQVRNSEKMESVLVLWKMAEEMKSPTSYDRWVKERL